MHWRQSDANFLMRFSGKLATGQVGLDKDSGKVESGKANILNIKV